ncbi:MAG TPA: NAD(P)-dependent oxidoreductase [Noviherbaspirillum sp.]|uniref:NAD(P)-dependent oxidoreductase n=1 Tax=Noviherbaspirillum sp. TaxID=1926288 RepID=UPI002B489097|nr:NAD(P)-dependent oxidoreductase [Noviherbaspirillum sp.]HJV84682.1 NAD(P)-dependent oxidoreductase [Noviherbaspirillum sp.]
MKIGFIGLGMMGYPMAHLLARAGHQLAVSDLNTETVSRFVAEHAGAVQGASPTQFADADIVITMLPDSNAVEATVLGTDAKPGVAASMKRGAVLIDMSSSEPMRSRQLAATLADMGIDYLDAPVSGGVKRAVDGSLAIMVGGDPVVAARCDAVLKTMGKNITQVGKAGAGHAMKALNNYVSAAGLVAAAEALHVGKAFGLDPEAMVNVMNNSTAKNNTTENKVKQFMLSGAFNSGFSLALMAKDLGIAMGLGKSVSQPMQLGDEVLQLWRDANEKLGKGADHTEMYRFLEGKDE